VVFAASLLFAGPAAAEAPAETPLPAWSAIGVSGPTNLPPATSEIQKLAVDAEGGTFTLTFAGQTTAAILFNAEASTVKSALDALSSVGGAGGEVAVEGGPGNPGAEHPYFVSFGGELAGVNVGQMSADGSDLTGGTHTATVTTQTGGGSPGSGQIAVYAQNIGGKATNGTTITLKDELPAGLEALSFTPPSGWSCAVSGTHRVITCTGTQAVGPGLTVSLPIPVTVTAGHTGALENHITVSGGGANNVGTYTEPVAISWGAAKPGLQAFTAGAYTAEGIETSQAGSHPFSASTAIFVNTVLSPAGVVVPSGDPKTISVDLPPGFLGNPTATPTCPEGTEGLGVTEDCPTVYPNSNVGSAGPVLERFGGAGESTPVSNLEAPIGFPAEFEFIIATEPIRVVGGLNSESDYSLNVSALNTPQIKAVFGSFFTFWGNPADPVHDSARGGASTAPETAFLTMPTDCAREAVEAEAPSVHLSFDTWLTVGQFATSTVHVPRVTGCDELEFKADFKFEPSNTKSDSPASFQTELTVPSEGLTNPSKLTTPEIKDTVVKLPEGVVLNASGANGLQACSESQIGLKNQIDPSTGLPKPEPSPNPMRFSKEENHCPEASKIGTGELKSALLEETLHGTLYLAAQGKANPFGSLFAVYLVIESPRNGVFIKLPGEVEPDSKTGQMSVSFENLPQLPFTTLKLSLKGGDTSALASPTTCGKYVTTATNTPWSYPESGPPTTSANGFQINQGPNGMPCANTPSERPFDIGWKAGTDSTSAGASGPFQFQITRPDGSQELTGLELNTPKGLSASLKGIPYCSGDQIKAAEQSTGKQEQSNPACPSASQVGTLQTGAGSGPTPFYVNGKVYLAGPYKGAPISVVAVTPAVAGPFDLGNVVVRSAVNINRSTAQVSAKTDEIPQILKGVALRIKDVRIKLDHKDWTINPTSCDASSVNLKATGNSGATAERSTRFQVGGCQNLPFGPKLKANLKGGTKRGAHPAFTATVNFPAGQANTKDVQVTLPHSEFLDQAHINTICTRVQAAANACPQGSIYGFAEATTPLIDGKLTGPVFLKSSDHQLPDLAIALKGPDNQPVEVEFQGRIDSVKAQIRNTIEGLPDVPVTKFVLSMKGGRKGLLVNSRNLCKGKTTKMTVKMTGQNNKQSESRPALTRSCKGKKVKKKRHRGHKRVQLNRLIAAW
jgi:hypothetical protein